MSTTDPQVDQATARANANTMIRRGESPERAAFLCHYEGPVEDLDAAPVADEPVGAQGAAPAAEGPPAPMVAAPEDLRDWQLEGLTPPQAGDTRPTILAARYPGSDVEAALLYPGMFHVVAGKAGAGKSWVAAIAAAEVVRGGSCCWWIDTDGMGRHRLHEYFRCLGLTDQMIRDNILYASAYGAPSPDALRAYFTAAAIDTVPQLVVIDSWGPALARMGLDQNLASDIDQYVSSVIDPIRAGAPDACILMLDHVNKGWSDESPTGSQRKEGAPDVVLSLRKDDDAQLTRTSPGRLDIGVRKDRGGFLTWGAEGRCRITITPSQLEYDVEVTLPVSIGADGVTYREPPTVLMAKVSLWMLQEGVTDDASAVTRKAIKDSVEGKASGITDAIEVLLANGYLARSEHKVGGYHRVYQVSHYTEGSELPAYALPEAPEAA